MIVPVWNFFNYPSTWTFIKYSRQTARLFFKLIGEGIKQVVIEAFLSITCITYYCLFMKNIVKRVKYSSDVQDNPCRVSKLCVV